jgi:hypothetical protein
MEEAEKRKQLASEKEARRQAAVARKQEALFREEKAQSKRADIAAKKEGTGGRSAPSAYSKIQSFSTPPG